MKRYNIIFPALLLTLTIMPFSVSALTVSGTVIDATGEPIIGATVQNPQTKQGVATDIDGKFTVTGTDLSELKISYIGYKTQTVKNLNEKNLIVKLEEDKAVALQEVVTVSCTSATKEKLKATEATATGAKGACIPTKCIGEPGEYEIKGTSFLDEDSNQCTSTKLDEDGEERKVCDAICVKVKCTDSELKALNATGGKVENGKCVPSTCIQDYVLKGNACIIRTECSQSELKAANATNGTWDKNLKACIPVCDEANGFTRNTKNICERTKCAKFEIDNLKKQDKNIDTVELDASGRCVPKTCKSKYHLENGKCEKNKCEKDEEDWDGTKCVKVRCSKADLEALKAKEGKWENNKCIPTKCLDDKNFKLENGSCGANDCPTKELEKLRASAGYMQDDKCIPTACITDYTLQSGACINKQKLEELQKAYDDAKAKEQSLENRMLTAATTAATGIGGMQALQGMAEQSADKDAAADMAAYIETMRCTYGDGKQVKAGPEEIELPGANDQELMNLRGQYLALAQDLKERKEALGMKPGIESEEIIDRTATGLYDDENVGITSGNYASLYRAMMLGSEADQAKIDDEQKTSANRVKGGATAAGLGVVAGLAGNSLINGKLGELLKSKKADKNDANKEEVKALDELKKCLKSAGVKDTDKLEFKNFYPSILSVRFVYCKSIKVKEPNAKASEIFVDSSDENEIFNGMDKYLDRETISKMVGFSKEETADNIKGTIKYYMSKKQKEIDEAREKDIKTNSKDLNNDTGTQYENTDIKGVVKQAVTGKIVKAETNQ